MFDLESYEDVNARIKKYREAHISSKIETDIVDINFEKGYVLFKAVLYREYEDLYPCATGYAFEQRSDRGVNRDFWVENAETSAVGRAIGLLMPSDKRPTRQDMEKVQRLSHVPAEPDPWATATLTVTTEGTAEPVGNTLQMVAEQLGGQIIEETPLCAHGRMLLKEGISSKTGKSYKGHVCPTKVKAEQCQPVWS